MLYFFWGDNIKICKKCGEINEDRASFCKNCLSDSFIDYEEEVKENQLKINKKLKLKRKIQILSTLLYFALSIFLVIIRHNIQAIDVHLLFMSIFLVMFSFLAIIFTEEICKLRLMFYVDTDNISISDINIYVTKISGIIGYLLFIYLLFFEKI